MRIGPGGVLALTLMVWACVWAVAATRDRPWREWFATPVAFSSGMLGAACLTTLNGLMRDFALAATMSQLEVRQQVLDGALSAYQALLPALFGVLLFGAVLVRSRARWGRGGSLALPAAIASLAMVFPVGVGFVTLTTFHLAFLTAGASQVGPQTLPVASGLLLVGIGAALLGLLACFFWMVAASIEWVQSRLEARGVT